MATVTGRFSAKEPMMANLPRKGGPSPEFLRIKAAFADQHKVAPSDYNPIEKRLEQHMKEVE